MSYYVCPVCGSSLDAGEQCSCGAREKPTLEVVNRQMHNTGIRENTKIYDEFNNIQQELLYQQAIQASAKVKHRKGIYEQICKKTKSQ